MAMLPEPYRWIEAEFEREGDPWQLFDIAGRLEADGLLEAAATVYDRAYGLDPAAPVIRAARQRLLDRLAVVEHDLRFCYIPGGVFLMGRDDGEPDERPLHPVWLSPYWLSETPISWAAYCRLMDWEPPPRGVPRQQEAPTGDLDYAAAALDHGNRIRLQYCEDRTTRARDWHAHIPRELWQTDGRTDSAEDHFGPPPRDDPAAPWTYDAKPMIAVSWRQAQELGERLSAGTTRYGLPTEAQWEKAARGGRIGARYAWGNEPPAHDRCDFDRFHALSILPMRTFPPNGYGLYAMNGGVWEWTQDWYDRDGYQRAPDTDPPGPPEGHEKVLRGGCWGDCAEVLTVTFRMSYRIAYRPRGPEGEEWNMNLTPNVGFRLCRTVVPSAG